MFTEYFDVSDGKVAMNKFRYF